MAETREANVSDEAYLAVHPQAETNFDRAKDMAIASKSHEVATNHLANMALMAAEGDKRGLVDYGSKNGQELPFGMRDKAFVARSSSSYMEDAMTERFAADAAADRAGKSFDGRAMVREAAEDIKAGRTTVRPDPALRSVPSPTNTRVA